MAGGCGNPRKRGSSAHRRAASTHDRGTGPTAAPLTRALTPRTRPATVGAVGWSQGARSAARLGSSHGPRGIPIAPSETGSQVPPSPHVRRRCTSGCTHGSTTPPSRSRAVDQPGRASVDEGLPWTSRAIAPTRGAATSRTSRSMRGQPSRRRVGDKTRSIVPVAMAGVGTRPSQTRLLPRSTAATVHGKPRLSRCHNAAAGGPAPTTTAVCSRTWTRATTMVRVNSKARANRSPTTFQRRILALRPEDGPDREPPDQPTSRPG